MDFLDIVNTVLLFAIALRLWLLPRLVEGGAEERAKAESPAPEPSALTLGDTPQFDRSGPGMEPGTDAWPDCGKEPHLNEEQVKTLLELQRVRDLPMRRLGEDIRCAEICRTLMMSRFFETILRRVPEGRLGDPDPSPGLRA